jgi:hypothetical protein
MTYYYNIYVLWFGRCWAVAARRSWFTHARVPIYYYNVVRTRSRKSCVRGGKTRENAGTELYVRACDGCSPTSMRRIITFHVRRVSIREIPLWGSRRFVRSIIVYVVAGVYRVHANNISMHTRYDVIHQTRSPPFFLQQYSCIRYLIFRIIIKFLTFFMLFRGVFQKYKSCIFQMRISLFYCKLFS